jgi:hypothetical protein
MATCKLGPFFSISTGNGGFTTSDATQQTALSADLSSILSGAGAALDNAGLFVEFIMLAKSSGNAVAGAKVAHIFKRIAGTVTRETSSLILMASGAAGVLLGNAALVTAALDVDSSGNSIRGRVTGVAATTIVWHGHLIISSGEFTG